MRSGFSRAETCIGAHEQFVKLRFRVRLAHAERAEDGTEKSERDVHDARIFQREDGFVLNPWRAAPFTVSGSTPMMLGLNRINTSDATNPTTNPGIAPSCFPNLREAKRPRRIAA